MGMCIGDSAASLALQPPLLLVHAKHVGDSERRKPFLQNKTTLKYQQNMPGVDVLLLKI